ncbi:MAG: hypothetical protein AAF399_25570, partial [Bacteroidota bacterium]
DHPFWAAKKDAKNRRSPMQRSMPPQHLRRSLFWGNRNGQPAVMVNALHRRTDSDCCPVGCLNPSHSTEIQLSTLCSLVVH